MSNQAIATKKEGPKSITEFLDQMKPEIAKALPRSISVDRMCRIALTEFRKNPELAVCDLTSFLGAIVQCAQLGLEPGSALGHVYLVPFNNRKRNCKEVQIIVGYKGLVELARRSGMVVSVTPRAVHEGDEFSYSYGLSEHCDHTPTSGTPGELSHVYAVVKYKDGATDFEVMTRAEIESVRSSLKFPNPVWKSHFEEMAKKTVVRRISKRLPLSPEFADLSRIDDSFGEQQNYSVLDADHDEPVTLATHSTTIKEVNAEMAAENSQKAATDLFANIEALIAVELESGVPKELIEEKIGISLNKVSECHLDQLSAIWDALN